MKEQVKKFKENFCKNLKLERKNRGYTLLDVANAIGITKQSYRLYETGESVPTFDNFLKLSIFFDMPLNEFIE